MSAAARDPEEPDWDLLPDDPVGFFGFTAPPAPVDLKRAYVRLLRRYKPERHPAEFMRLRTAYEALEARLRYGSVGERRLGSAAPVEADAAPARGDDAHVPTSRPVPEPGECDPPVGQPPLAPVAAPLDAAALVRELGTEAARERLVILADAGNGPAWCALALVEDTLRPGVHALQHTLVRGLRATGGHPVILELLLAALREDIDPGASETLVRELAQEARGPLRGGALDPLRFWYLTEALWLGLATKAPFETWSALFASCRADLDQHEDLGELVLLLRLRRRAAWSASEAWLAEADATLAERAGALPPWMQHELDLLLWIDRYRPQRETFLAQHPFCVVFDRALEAIVSGDDLAAERAYVAAQAEVLARRQEAFAALSIESPAIASAVEILTWYGEQRLDRGASSSASNSVSEASALELGRRLRARTTWSLDGIALDAVASGSYVASVVGSLLIALGSSHWVGEWAFIVAIVVTSALVIAWRRGMFAPILLRITRRLRRSLHTRVLRPILADHLERTYAPFEAVVAQLGRTQSGLGWLEYHEIARDRALRVHSLAVRTLG